MRTIFDLPALGHSDLWKKLDDHRVLAIDCLGRFSIGSSVEFIKAESSMRRTKGPSISSDMKQENLVENANKIALNATILASNALVVVHTKLEQIEEDKRPVSLEEVQELLARLLDCEHGFSNARFFPDLATKITLHRERETLASRPQKAAIARHAPRNRIKAELPDKIRCYAEQGVTNLSEIAFQLEPEITKRLIKEGAALTPQNAQKQIYRWLLAAKKEVK